MDSCVLCNVLWIVYNNCKCIITNVLGVMHRTCLKDSFWMIDIVIVIFMNQLSEEVNVYDLELY